MEKKKEDIEKKKKSFEDTEIDEIEETKDEYEDELTMEERVINIEKRVNIILILIIVTAVFSLISMIYSINNTSSSSSSSSSSESSSSETYSYDTSSFKEISASDIKTDSDGQTIIVMIGRQGCYYCSVYAPILAEVQSTYGFTAEYIDLTDIVDISAGSIIDETAYNTLYNLDVASTCTSLAYDTSGNLIECDEFMENEFGATPLTLAIKNNKLVGGIAGYVDADSLADFLETVGFSS